MFSWLKYLFEMWSNVSSESNKDKVQSDSLSDMGEKVLSLEEQPSPASQNKTSSIGLNQRLNSHLQKRTNWLIKNGLKGLMR